MESHITILFYLFILFLAVLGLSWGRRDLHCGMQDLLLRCTGSSLWCMGFSLIVARGFSSCSMQAPEHMGSVVVAHVLSSCDMRA